MRTTKKYTLTASKKFKEKLLSWANQFEEVVWLDSNEYQFSSAKYDAILAVEAFTSIKTDTLDAFDQLKEYQETTKDWIFGYLTYDLKNDVENLTSKNIDGLHFPALYFIQPKKIFLIKDDEIQLHYLAMVDDELETDWEEICAYKITDEVEENIVQSPVKSRLSEDEYVEKVEKMLAHIFRGDIYEANFCQEFYLENALLNPLETYFQLNQLSTPPFAAYCKLEDYYLLSASPERYIKKTGNKIISQPIKGTARRLENKEEDDLLKNQLQNDPKERAENIMIVDLVRNDLSKTATKASVEVEELCGLYTFQQVHQLISTISSKVDLNLSPIEILRTTFPMGSMTGAPKVSAMQIIEDLEVSKRGLYSGSLGYFTPEGDFDFSVIIRSILYNQEKKYASFSVGSAITAKSDPKKEYEECLIKAAAMKKALNL
ncbi:anthranilate synthase component I family protein [Mesonia aquimarina]|uniref:anthranilate synthase component I family protein n=1 Tax=Mesonia aquimarina TaxID=1504967 RepID=UPI000EF5B23C|nr:anthranilate synthase component I family protein [Mesonia aquimarina]